ncbi:MAG: BON domain-containing protein [Pelovirga sp.]
MVKPHRIITFLVLLVMMVAFLGCASTSKQASTGEYIDDRVTTAKIKAAIFDEPTLKSMQINVETFKGDVQLSGFVDSAQSVTKAGEVTRGVDGVKSVKNDLIVR